MKHPIRPLTYRQKITYAFSALIVLPMVLFAYFLFRYNIVQNEKQFTEQSQRVSAVYMEAVTDLFTLCMQKLDVVENNYTLQKYLTSQDNDLSDLVEMRYYLDALHDSLVLGAENLEVTVYRFRSNRFPSGFVKLADQLEDSVVQSCLNQRFGEILMQYEEGSEAFHFYKLNRRLNNELLSITEVALPFLSLSSLFHPGLEDSGFTAVFRTAGDMGLPLNKAVLPDSEYAAYLQGAPCRDALILEAALQKSSLNFRQTTRSLSPFQKPDRLPEASGYGSVVFFFPSTPIYSSVWVMAPFLLLFAALIFFLVEWMSRLMTRKLDSIVIKIRAAYRPGQALPNDNRDEFAIISGKITEMLNELNTQYEKEKAGSLEKKELETQLLQELINPHFLYNTLDSIKWLSENPKVSQAVDSIVDYYRLLLSKGKLFVPIDTELRIVEEYVRIQRFAYESDFRYTVEVAEGLQSQFVMKHILQPFVENALLHGIDKSGDNGEIRLRVWREEALVVFEITDNGCGAEQSQVDRALDGTGLEGQGGYGMLNVKKRLQNVYGADASVRIQTAPGKGTKVTLRLPLSKC